MLPITPLAPADRAEWERLFRSYNGFSGRDVAQAAYDRAWAEIMAGARLHALGARVDGGLAGFAHFVTHPSVAGPDVCYLEDLFTDEAARRRGAGRALIAAVGAWARGQGCARLYWLTHEDNALARALYDNVAVRSGFIEYEVTLGPGGRDGDPCSPPPRELR